MTTHKFLDCDKDRIEKTARDTIKMSDEYRPFTKIQIAQCSAYMRRLTPERLHNEEAAFQYAWHQDRREIAKSSLARLRDAKKNARQALKEIGRWSTN